MHIWGSITHNPVYYPIYSLHLTCPCRGDTVRSSGGWAFVALLLISASAHRCECSCVVSSMFARVQSGPVSGAQRGTAGSFSLTSTPTAPLLVSVCQGPSCVCSAERAPFASPACPPGPSLGGLDRLTPDPGLGGLRWIPAQRGTITAAASAARKSQPRMFGRCIRGLLTGE